MGNCFGQKTPENATEASNLLSTRVQQECQDHMESSRFWACIFKFTNNSIAILLFLCHSAAIALGFVIASAANNPDLTQKLGFVTGAIGIFGGIIYGSVTQFKIPQQAKNSENDVDKYQKLILDLYGIKCENLSPTAEFQAIRNLISQLGILELSSFNASLVNVDDITQQSHTSIDH